jgi:hypothetical protein
VLVGEEVAGDVIAESTVCLELVLFEDEVPRRLLF